MLPNLRPRCNEKSEAAADSHVSNMTGMWQVIGFDSLIAGIRERQASRLLWADYSRRLYENEAFAGVGFFPHGIAGCVRQPSSACCSARYAPGKRTRWRWE